MICNLCKKEIIVQEDKYVHVEDYEKEKKKSEMWMHYECFK